MAQAGHKQHCPRGAAVRRFGTWQLLAHSSGTRGCGTLEVCLPLPRSSCAGLALALAGELLKQQHFTKVIFPSYALYFCVKHPHRGRI